jgi:protoheme ferro-lyase
MYGFEIHNRWSLMGGRSPFYEQTQPQKEEVKKRLEKKYGDEIVVRFAYGIDPHPHKKIQTPMAVIKELVKHDNITHLAVSEHFSVTSDSMSTFHLREHSEHALHETGADIPLAFAEQLGGTEAFDEGIVQKTKEELNQLPKDANVAVFLSNHGFPTTKIGKYDASTDSYHQNVKLVYSSAEHAIQQNVKWEGELKVMQVFGQFLGERYNPGQKMMSPQRALDIASSQGFTHVVDIPYEFPGDSVDILVKLRQAYGLKELPNWSENYETRLKFKDLDVKITSANFYPEHWIESYRQRTVDAIERAIAGKRTSESRH